MTPGPIARRLASVVVGGRSNPQNLQLGPAINRSQLPVTKLIRKEPSVETRCSFNLAPAPLDEISLFNGVLKFDHEQAEVSQEEMDFVLDRLCECYSPYLRRCRVLDTGEIEQYVEPLTSCGKPYSSKFGSRKIDVLRRMSVQELLNDFANYDQIISSTLKDELRPPEKDARLFRPANLATICEGIRLFADQNDKMMSARLRTPFKVGISTPGPEMWSFWEHVRKLPRDGRFAACDGSAWDARFQLWQIWICREFRKRFLPADSWAAVDRYYSQTYFGWTAVDGQLWRLVGNPSGHFNTTPDNSLALHAAYILFCRNYKYPMEKVELAVYGDDSLFWVQDPFFSNQQLIDGFSEFGNELECIGEISTALEDCVFIGTHISGAGFSYDEDNLMASLKWTETGRNPLDYVRKIVAITCLLWCSPLYGELHESVCSYVERHYPEFVHELRYCSPYKCERIYRGFESLEGCVKEIEYLLGKGGKDAPADT